LLTDKAPKKVVQSEPASPTSSNSRPQAAFKAHDDKSSSFAEMAKSSKTNTFDHLLSSAAEKNDSSAEKVPTKKEEAATVAMPTNVMTGEEDEVTAWKAHAAIKLYDALSKKWIQKGAGPMHVNLKMDEEDGKIRCRIGILRLPSFITDLCLIVARHLSTLALILNIPVFNEMSVKLVQERTLLVGAIEEGKIVTYALQVRFYLTLKCLYMCKLII
jgi:hypothetical protein